LKGISLNATLSREQIEEIASLSAEKVLQTNSRRYDNEEWYKMEIENLKREITRLNRMIVEREINLDRNRNANTFYRELVSKYEEKFGKI
jgi:hypothetical protein